MRNPSERFWTIWALCWLGWSLVWFSIAVFDGLPWWLLLGVWVPTLVFQLWVVGGMVGIRKRVP